MVLEEKPKGILTIDELCKNDMPLATSTLYEHNLLELLARRIHDLARKIRPNKKQEALFTSHGLCIYG
jgi:hypothetical protein